MYIRVYIYTKYIYRNFHYFIFTGTSVNSAPTLIHQAPNASIIKTPFATLL